MAIKRTWIALLFCIALVSNTDAQTALQKAKSYASQNAPFLSIKYLKKHIDKKEKDRSAMLMIAKTYFKVNLPEEGQKWLLKVNDCSTPYAYFQKIIKKQDITKELQNQGINMMKKHIIHVYERPEMESIAISRPMPSKEELLTVVDVVGVFL